MTLVVLNFTGGHNLLTLSECGNKFVPGKKVGEKRQSVRP